MVKYGVLCTVRASKVKGVKLAMVEGARVGSGKAEGVRSR